MPAEFAENLRPMVAADFDAVAELICASTNAWYKANRGFEVFAGGAASCRLFPETYEALDPGRCVVAVDPGTGRLIGSCFYHPRDTHVSLGIMNVHPEAFGQGVASRLVRHVTNYADRVGKPVRLVSSAMNLDSFSAYSRAGFVPVASYADMMIAPERTAVIEHADLGRVRPAVEGDVPAMVQLEDEVSGIRREKDFRFFNENKQGIWHTLVIEGTGGQLDGFLASVHHAASHMLGPGVMRDDRAAAALIAAQLRRHAGRSPVFLVPLDRPELVRQMYAWGARNVELHFAQVRGEAKPFRGVAMPTFMPETG